MGSGHDNTIVPTIPPNTAHPSSVLTSLSNGLVSNNVPYQQPPNFLYLWSPVFNLSSTNSAVDEGNGAWSWNFAFPSTQAQRHADVSIDPGTRRVRCTQSEQGLLAAEVNDLGVPSFMPAWPQAAWLNWDGTKASTPAETTDIPRRPLDYAIGLHYIAANSSTASVRYTAQTTDPSSWATIAIPAGQDWVDIPTGSKAMWVGCDVQVPEVFPDLTAVGRYSVMGTQIPSDVIPGPDHS
jgi:hypothetical protein